MSVKRNWDLVRFIVIGVVNPRWSTPDLILQGFSPYEIIYHMELCIQGCLITWIGPYDRGRYQATAKGVDFYHMVRDGERWAAVSQRIRETHRATFKEIQELYNEGEAK